MAHQLSVRPDAPDVVRSTAGLITYLRELVVTGRQPIRDCAHYDDRIWLADLPDGVDQPEPRADGVLLVLDHVPRMPPPALPDVLDGWVERDRLDDAVGGDPPLAAEGPGEGWTRDENSLPVRRRGVIARDDDPAVPATYGKWVITWRVWAERERSARPRRALYERLAKIGRKLSLQDDICELVLGVGLLTWNSTAGDRVARHLITCRLGVTIDRKTARLSVSLLADTPVRLEDRDFLREDDGFVADRTEMIRADLAADAPYLLSQESIALLERWQSHSFARAVRFDARYGPRPEADDVPHLTFAPALILRSRDRNAWVDYYDRIAASLSGSDGHCPLGLAQLLYPLEEAERAAWADRSYAGERREFLGADPLFPLHTNPAQRTVLDRLSRDSAVVVQGPPGTGKTHTIANLVSALVAQGKRILVTSQKDQALKVLRDKLPEPIRELCVLLTDVQRGGSDELERSITALSDRAATVDPSRLQQRIASLDLQRAGLRERKARLVEQLRSLREAEIVEHSEVAAGYRGTLAQIVEAVVAGRDRHGWIPALPDLAPQKPPVSVAEAVELLELVNCFADSPTAEPDENPPRVAALPTVEIFARIVSIVEGASRQAQQDDDPLAQRLGELGPEMDRLRALVETAADEVHRLGMSESARSWDGSDWRTRALLDRLARRNLPLWEHIAAAEEEAEVAQRRLAELAIRPVMLPLLSIGSAASMAAAGERLHAHLVGGGRLRRMLPSPPQRAAAEMLSSCTVDGQAPISAADVAMIVARLRIEVTAALLTERWTAAGVQEPSGSLAERLAILIERSGDLQKIQRFGEARDAIDSLLLSNGLRISLGTAPEWDAFNRSVTRARSYVDLHGAVQFLKQVMRVLAHEPPSRLARALVAAVEARDVSAYEATLDEVRLETVRRQRVARRDELLSTLRAAHPLLADAIVRTRDDADGRRVLTTLPDAWAWAVAARFCERQRTPDLDRRLQNELDQVEGDLARTVAELAAEQAWLHCLTRMTQAQRQALQQYKTHMAAVGKGRGRYTQRRQRAAREAMGQARDAVPAWVMPLQHVVDTIPPTPDSFDVVIIDEASQVSIDALFLLWLAPRVVVVGDDKQCAPSAVAAGELQKVYDRLDTYLPDIPLSQRDGFTPRSNLYELLSGRFPEVVRLTEHFRCMPEIIGWSSRTFYRNTLIPLRQFGADRLDPLQVHRVSGGYVEGRDAAIRNPVEAEAIMGVLREILVDPRFTDRSIGIIPLQGYGQARLIEDMVTVEIGPAEIENRRIRVGTPPEFQGDERDIILLSMVINEPARALGTPEEQRKFNVAASRARDQMWLFTSVDESRLKQHDLRRSLLSYMLAPPPTGEFADDVGPVDPDVRHPRFDSLFEQRVYLRIRQRGFHVVPQVPVDGRRIDLVVVGSNGRLAVECDGRQWHTDPAQLYADLERERELIRVGWQFWRIRESEFYFDRDRALEPLWAELVRRGIAPGAIDPMTDKPVNIEWRPVDLAEGDHTD